MTTRTYNIAYYFLTLRSIDTYKAMTYLNNKDYNISEQVKQFLRYNHQIKFI